MRRGLAWTAALPLGGLACLWARLGLEAGPGWEKLAPWISGAGLALQLYGSQRALGARDGGGLAAALEPLLAGWFLFSLGLPGPWAALGALNFLVQALLLKLPLQALLWSGGLGAPWLLLGGLLALAGCLPFSAFSAYFQAFIPLMRVGEGVGDMQQKLFSAAGIWASLAMLAVVWQTGALAVFYWQRVLSLPKPEAPAPAWARIWMAASLAASLALGLAAGQLSAWLRAILGLMRPS